MTGRKNATKSLLFGYRKWNILAFRRRLMSLVVLTHCGVSSGPLLLQESRIFHLLVYAIIHTVCFTILIHPGQFHKYFSLFITRTIRYSVFRCPKHYTVDWNGRRRLLGLRLLDPPKTFAGIA